MRTSADAVGPIFPGGIGWSPAPFGPVLLRAPRPPEPGGRAMMPRRERARRFVRALVGGMTLVVAVTLAGCGTKGGGDSNTASWDHYIQAMDDALTRGDFYAADLARQTAYLLALGSRHWEPMVAVGAAYLRFADSPG